MKRFLTSVIAIVMLVSITDASAKGHRHQRPHRDIYTATDGLGVSFSYVHSFYRLDDWYAGEKTSQDGLNGFNLGVTKDFRIIDNALYFQTGLVYTYQTRNLSSRRGENMKVMGSLNEHFLSIPLKIKFELPVMRNLNVFIMGGPTLDEGLSSKMTYRAKVNGDNFAVSYNCYSGRIRSNSELLEGIVSPEFHETKYRRPDVQVGFSAGVRFLERFEAQFGYDWGLINKFKGELGKEFTMRRQLFYISVGVRF